MGTVLYRVHEDIQQHSVALAWIKIHIGDVLVSLQDYVDVYCVFLSNYVFDTLRNPPVEVGPLYLEAVFSHLHLSQVEDHVQKLPHSA